MAKAPRTEGQLMRELGVDRVTLRRMLFQAASRIEAGPKGWQTADQCATEARELLDAVCDIFGDRPVLPPIKVEIDAL